MFEHKVGTRCSMQRPQCNTSHRMRVCPAPKACPRLPKSPSLLSKPGMYDCTPAAAAAAAAGKEEWMLAGAAIATEAHQNITLEDVNTHGHLKGVLLSGMLGHALEVSQIFFLWLLLKNCDRACTHSQHAAQVSACTGMSDALASSFHFAAKAHSNSIIKQQWQLLETSKLITPVCSGGIQGCMCQKSCSYVMCQQSLSLTKHCQ